MRIERAQSHADWREIRRLCCLTGASGGPVLPESRWDFFGELWVGPYERLAPEWAFVARDDARGSVVGYLTGCADSRRFTRLKRLLLTPRLWAGLARGRWEWNADTRRFLRRSLGFERGPEQSFSSALHAVLESQFPAHLHINLSAEARGKGTGQKLVSCFFDELRERIGAAAGGVHVFCGPDPVPFYERVGFRELERIDFKTESGRTVPVFALGARLTRA